MKKVLRGGVAVAICALLVSALMIMGFSADPAKVSIRIEGIEKCLYEGEYSYKGDGETLADLLLAFDADTDEVAFTGIESNYISKINDDAAAAFGGWDGWLFMVNGVDATAGVADTAFADGDDIVFYYGDPFGVGFQFPVMDTDRAEEGELVFTSTDTVWNADGTQTVSENPVAGMTVIIPELDFNGTTDENGKVTFDAPAAGDYTVEVSKISDAGCPLVLRFASGTGFTVAAEEESTEDEIPVPGTEAPAADAAEAPATEAPATDKAEETEAPASAEPTSEVPATAEPETSPATTEAGTAPATTENAKQTTTKRASYTSRSSSTTRGTSGTKANPATGEKLILPIALLVLVVGIAAIAIATVMNKNRKGGKQNDDDDDE